MMPNQKNTAPPKLIEKMGGWLLPAAEGEFLLGDLAELYQAEVGENGRFYQNLRYCLQLGTAVGYGFQHRLFHVQKRSMAMFRPITKPDIQRFILSLLLLLPVLAIASTGVLHSFLGYSAPMNNLFHYLQHTPLLGWLVHPFVVLGGVIGAFLVSIRPFINLSVSREKKMVHGTLTLTKGNALSWLIFGLLSLLVLIVGLYLFVENYGFLF